MKIFSATIALIMLVLSTNAYARTLPKAPIATNCHAKASQVWQAGNKKLLIEAFAEGPNCKKAIVTLVIRNSSGTPIWYDVSTVSDNMVLSENPSANSVAMGKILKNWIMIDNSQRPSDSLPEWKANSQAPEAEEFPFYPSETISRDEYTMLRNSKLPMFCFVTGMESSTCLVLKTDGTITDIGTQTFPG
ncbi:MAG: hypothetical protein J0L55_17620 [Caulobacterales bacterium]|nr:hypothetical protein [Caulobacterales bacterium]